MSKDPIEKSRKDKMQKPVPFPPPEAKETSPGVYQTPKLIYVGDKL